MMVEPNQCYQHYKGGRYRVLHLAKDAGTTEDVVVYQNVEDLVIWVRPLAEFKEQVMVQDTQVQRFTKIDFL
jgi:hypothetical protein